MKRILVILTCIYTSTVFSQEICDNGIDDDGDLLIDLNDVADCSCDLEIIADLGVIPNSNLEDRSCCPADFAEMNCVNGWFAGGVGTVDYLNTCGFFYDPVISQPVPSGQGVLGSIVGNTNFNNTILPYMEFPTTCLNEPLLADSTYTFSFYISGGSSEVFRSRNERCNYDLEPLNITLYGNPSCRPNYDVPGPIDYECPTNWPGEGWVELGVILYDPNHDWAEVEISFTPNIGIQQIAVGGPCNLPNDYGQRGRQPNGCSAYFFYDNFVIETTKEIDMELTGNACDDNLVLTAHPDVLTGNYQWFRDGIALVGQTDTILAISSNDLEDGEYTFRLGPGTGLVNCVTNSISVVSEVDQIDLDNLAFEGCAPAEINFTTTVNGSGFPMCFWGFGDGNTSNSCNPTHTYNDPGVYNLTVNISNPGQCALDTVLEDFITVLDDYETDFIIDKDSLNICINDSILFTEQSNIPSNENGYLFSWNFGDGNSAFGRVVRHAYSATGTYQVVLTPIPNTVGLCGTESDTMTLVVSEGASVTIGNDTTTCDETFSLEINNPSSDVIDLTVSVNGVDTVLQSINPGNQNAVFSLDEAVTQFQLRTVTGSGTGCALSVDTTTIVVQFGNLISSITPDTAICEGDSIQLVATGGTAYQWIEGIASLSSTTISNPWARPITSTTYLVEIRDGNCAVRDSVGVFILPSIVLNTPLFEGCGPAEINFTTTVNGSGFPVCFWDFGDGNTSNSCNPTHTYSDPGVYDLTVNISNPGQCALDTILEDFITVLDDYETDFIIDKDSLNICINDSILFTEQSNIPSNENGYLFSWNFGDGNSAFGRIVRHAYSATGTYQVVLTPIPNTVGLCGTESDTMTLVVSEGATISIGNDTTLCEGPFSLSINNPSTDIIDLTVSVNGIDTLLQSVNPGNQSIWFALDEAITVFQLRNVISSGTGCPLSVDTTSITVQFGSINTSITADAEICVGDSIQLLATGGDAYVWVQGTASLSSSTIANPWARPTATTEYIVRISENGGCESQDTVSITVFPVLNTSISNDTSICLGDTVQLSAMGGSVYEWVTGSISLSNSNISNPLAFPSTSTLYIVQLNSMGSCPSTDSVRITVAPLPIVEAGPDLLRCSGNSAVLNASGAVSYQWSPVGGLSNANIANPVASPTATTRYTVRGTDTMGCSNDDEILFSISPASSASITVRENSTQLCEGDMVMIDTADVTGQGNTPTFTWYSSTDGGITFTTFPATTIPLVRNDLVDGQIIYLELFSSDSCSTGPVNSNQLIFDVLSYPEGELGLADSICEGQRLDLQVFENMGLTNLSYQWFYSRDGNNPYTSIDGTNASIYNATEAGFYQVELTHSSLCADTSNNIELSVVTMFLEAQISATEIREGEYVTLSANTDADSVRWTVLSDNEVLLNGVNEAVVHLPNDSETYQINAIKGPCEQVQTVSTRLIRKVRVPNVITPGGDGFNDVWIIDHIEDYPEAKIKVYNRYGVLVFESGDSYDNDWDGTHKGKDLPMGTYYYVIDLGDQYDGLSGFITIVH